MRMVWRRRLAGLAVYLGAFADQRMVSRRSAGYWQMLQLSPALCSEVQAQTGQTVAINQSHWGKEMHEIAARRAAKKAGVKTIQGKR